MTRMRDRIRDERGIALVVVLIAVVVVSGMGAALTVSALRDLDSSTSVQRASSALAVAEAGVQHAMQMLSGPNFADLKDARDDSTGTGVWMNTNATIPPADPYQGDVGATGRYTTYILELTAINIDQKIPGIYRIVSTGVDNRTNPNRPGVRTVYQDVRIVILEVPFSMFSQTTLSQNGTPTLRNISIYSGENVFHRSGTLPAKPLFEAAPAGYPNAYDPTGTLPDGCRWPTGCDLFYEGTGPLCPLAPMPCRLPAAVNSLGVIYKGGPVGSDVPPAGKDKDKIHRNNSHADCEVPFDRDSEGGTYPSPWPCAAAGPEPPYPTEATCPAGALNRGSCLGRLPFDGDLPNEDTYRQLKAMARGTGTYCKHTANSTLGIADPTPYSTCKDETGATVEVGANIEALKTAGRKFFVLYIDSAAGAGTIDINATWGPQVDPPESVGPNDPGCGSMGIIVVRNGNVKWNNAGNWWGAGFVTGSVASSTGDFSGAAAAGSGWFVGTVKSASINNAGNLRFQLNNCWKNSIPGFNTSVQRLRWHEQDR